MDYDTLTRAIYLQYRSLFDRAPAATSRCVLVGLTAIALVARVPDPPARPRSTGAGPGRSGRARSSHSVAGRRRRSRSARRSSALFLVLPAGVLGYWLVRGIANERELDVAVARGAHSLVASGLAAASPSSRRSPSRAGGALPVAARRACSSGSLRGKRPARARIALSLVFFAARYASPLYQTLALLVFAYVVRFFPQGLSGVESALERGEPALRGGRARARRGRSARR